MGEREEGLSKFGTDKTGGSFGQQAMGGSRLYTQKEEGECLQRAACNKERFLTSFSAVDFIHRNFSKFILHSTTMSVFASASGDARRNLLTELVLALLKVNGTPLMDISMDISPKNASR